MYLLSLAEQYCPRFCKPVFDRVKYSPIGKQVLSGAFWSVLGTGLARGLTFCMMVLIARILGKEVFGEFGLVRATATMFLAFSTFGMGVTATKYIAEMLATDKDRTGRIIGLSYLFTVFSSFVVAVVFYFAAPWLCENRLNAPGLVGPMRLGALLLFITTITGTQISVMTGFQDFRGMAFANILAALLSIPIYLIGAFYWGLYGVITGAIAAVTLNLLINSGFIYRNTRKHQIRYAFTQAYRELPILWKSNIPLTISSIIISFSLWVPQILIGSCENGMAELGVLYVVLNLQLAMSLLPQQFLPVFLPILSELSGRNEENRFWKVVLKGCFFNAVISLAIIMPFALFPRFFLGLSGSDYVESHWVLYVACLAAFANNLSGYSAQVLISRGRNWTQMFLAILSTGLYIVSVLFLLHFGAVSVFWGRAVAGLVHFLLALVFVFTSLKNVK